MNTRQDITAIAYDKRGMILSIGKNSYVKTHTYQARLAKVVGLPEKIYLHAEIDALLKARGKKVHTLVVTRVNGCGEYGNAKPCKICQEAIKQFGVKVLRHT